ncbi:hypothetical protein C6988_01555 [Nitrosopumilus sp. b1]|uniref:hypothetical protein n=1 Tax=Nitrosopumilus sp. b1 TaxID=2109907 RepID=UPI0015F6F80E|nr:hypothetical protein [Nitrosopumilus sp. b1]KAF6243875.1 hypothetical protein C6988_01555 [Nitrosopumilus sp. b1]
MAEPNYAGNIIVNLASLPDFLRKPILKKRLNEFFSLSDEERIEIINNALQAGPTIPFPNFSKLFKTWLESLASMSEEQRDILFSAYVNEIIKSPQKLIVFNLDGILEIFLSLRQDEKNIISKTIQNIFSRLEPQQKNKMRIIIPDSAKASLGI